MLSSVAGRAKHALSALSANSMSRRQFLTICLAVVSLAGLGGLSTIFLGALRPSASAENDRWIVVDVNAMKSGEAKFVEEGFYVYRLASEDRDIQASDFLVLKSNSPPRGCALEFVPPGTRSYSWDRRKEFRSIPHFTESCDGGIWSIEGKYLGAGHPDASDLERKVFKVTRSGDILVRV